ncbi:hypothetical protein DTO013E5_9409 [Penicillium roqueforti]|uniref:Genomic scaffold, ProqFM164S02 n=1 Tax=Penicillium roqueforti (strain FM164) TaxID=1365484 RepID=W6Q916_PENRF|nr:uncharacterized protein LCP9604111_9481 [Penicillium roqueforti]CDM32880.1 unnamed protein product [Penicillium roqueforti FM164]KAF9238455.1 hypothetical protein LCP9604111_9481 [Penicillium roqueforti]KAI1830137.1 hypothetical protein CBS147337_9055 [Penicillium roqueforti]KAI2672392.1 hypothetical protein CBS147355_8112 [Penicillium roqueforti]KAI2675674.1 hypothetical protein LCP963914a_8511 [Penicillium roqueforti]
MAESFAILRQRRSNELTSLANEHLQHDLNAEDRDKLNAASRSISTWTAIGSGVGITLGLVAAIRFRNSRKAFFSAIRAQDRPTKVMFEDGRTEAIPDLTPLLKPTTLGDFATYFLAAAGGLFLGGELGFAGGVAKGTWSLDADPQSKERIETAFRKFRADVLRKQADAFDKGENNSYLL